jgi:hypothetical protein
MRCLFSQFFAVGIDFLLSSDCIGYVDNDNDNNPKKVSNNNNIDDANADNINSNGI